MTTLEEITDAVWELAHNSGWVAGWNAGWADHGDQVDVWLGHVREGLRTPRHADLEARREFSDDPCARECGRCSKCFRSEVVNRNLVSFGSPDFPGTDHLRGAAKKVAA